MDVWKAFPFRSGNRMWLAVLLQAYSLVIIGCFLLACILNSVEGEKWLHSGVRGNGLTAKGSTALDECFWFVFTTVHGIGFGEFMPRGTAGRIISMMCCALGYWLLIFVVSIVVMSQLPGERIPMLTDVCSRMVSAVWPSYTVFLFIVFCVGSSAGPYVSKDYEGRNEWPTGVYWLWQVAHRMPYGDLFPNTVWGRTITIPMAMLGNLYIPYAIALIAVRRPSLAQHEELLQNLKERPHDALGPGYIVPQGGGGSMREFVIDEYQPDLPTNFG